MYLQHFNLREQPFSITPDPKFIFWSKQHEIASESLLFGIQHRKGFLLLTGEIGTGKTTLCRGLIQRLTMGTVTSIILNPLLTVGGLLCAINDDFGNSISSQHPQDQMAGLNRFLLAETAKGHNAVVLIDEAQILSVEALEMVRLLSNLETEKQKLLQILLVGQPELEQKLRSYELRQLNQRISIRQRLDVLEFSEAKSYIFHRLSTAGADGYLSFDAPSLRRIYSYTQGYPRLINILCDRILLAAFAQQTRLINKKVVVAAIADLTNGARKNWWRIW